VGESLRHGDRLLATGYVKAYTRTPFCGPNADTEPQVVIDEIGPSLRSPPPRPVKGSSWRVFCRARSTGDYAVLAARRVRPVAA
jgi:hypothetical protein